MPSTLGEITTPHVIVRFQLVGHDKARLRFTKQLVEKALSGDETAQTKICTKLRREINSKGGHYRFIEWNPSFMAEFFEDRHELPHVLFPTDEEIAEAVFLFNPENFRETPPLSDSQIGCECVPQSVR
jgi:hypothetical protein